MPRVAFVGDGPDAGAAWDLLDTLPGAARLALAPSALARLPAAAADGLAVVWVHALPELPVVARAPLLAWLSDGGRLLLTQQAVLNVGALGLESVLPNDVHEGVWRHAADEFWFPELRDHLAFPHVRGVAGFGPHPLFAGLGQGTYLWAPAEGERFGRVTYTGGQRPAQGAVVGCERSYIHCNADRVVAWEYAIGTGGVLCIGAFVVPAAVDERCRPQLRALLANALTGPAIPHGGRPGAVTHWPQPGSRAVADPDLVLPRTPALSAGLAGLGSDLCVVALPRDDAPFDVAGRRVLVVGNERTGVREIWMHPHRVLQGLAITLDGDAPSVAEVRIAPTGVERSFALRGARVTEAVTTALEDAVAVLEYQCDVPPGRAGVDLALEWTVDLRRAWPCEATADGDLRYRVAPDGRIVLFARTSGAQVCVVTNRAVQWEIRPEPDRPAVALRGRAVLDAPLRLALVGGGSAPQFETAWRSLERSGFEGLSRRRARHERQVREGGVRVVSPDPRLNSAVEWAKLRLDAFVIDTPGIGRGLAAGYAASRPGWGEGRPGYGWYFGRDACWTALAQLAAGDHLTPRLVLEFLGATQDVTGKVIHELTTSGFAHYDAADSTPLYLLLAGRYAAWTGDLTMLETAWPALERAYRFCLATDRDDDGLIENTGVGHGWIEMGPLSGSHVTLYLAAVWVAALESLAPVARALGRAPLATELDERAQRARDAIAARFVGPDGYALGLLADGTRQAHPTALTAVAVLLRAVDLAPAGPWLDAIATSRFTAPWGVRLLSTDDSLYDPAGYHRGAVWPLYTGWVSLAEYAAHRSAAAFGHLAANARLPFARQLGAFAEVLRGDREQTAGVCPDQAWSAAMLLLPLIDGMLGARPDAVAGRLWLTPHLPEAWEACAWHGLRVGASTLDVWMVADTERTRVRVARTSGAAIGVTVSTAVPAGSAVRDARVDEMPVQPRIETPAGCPHATVACTAIGAHEIELWHGGERAAR